MPSMQLKIVFPVSVKKEHLVGLLLSYFSAIQEVAEGTRKSSYLNQFYQERLNKLDKRLLSSSIGQLQKELEKLNETKILNENLIEEIESIPQKFRGILDLFYKKRIFDFEGANSFSSGPFGGTIELEVSIKEKGNL